MLSSNQEYVDNPHHKHKTARQIFKILKLEIYAVDQTILKARSHYDGNDTFYKYFSVSLLLQCEHLYLFA